MEYWNIILNFESNFESLYTQNGRRAGLRKLNMTVLAVISCIFGSISAISFVGMLSEIVLYN